jgi:hypothetical protein
MTSTRKWLLICGIIAILIVVGGFWWWKSHEAVLLAKAEDIRRDLLQAIPLGSEMATAEEVLKDRGFQIARVDGPSGWYLQGENKVPAGWPVYRRINIKAVQTDSKLTDIQVFTDLAGP